MGTGIVIVLNVDGSVVVTGGTVKGREREGVWSFSGIPYAASPAGEGRWRPPAPVVPWRGVLEADRFGAVAPQPPPTPGMTIPGDPEEQDEDCLTLNIWTPAPDGARRPVMVWIHGGGFTAGTGAGLLYRGGDLARRGDVVVVTINYRLGALGFLGHPQLTAGPEAGGWGTGATGNWGLMDQVAALRWVQANIRAFGGDPEQVTVFGESAGAMSIASLLAAPAARGLFRRAIVQSGPAYTYSLARAAARADEFAGLLGLTEVSRDRLVRVPASELVAAAKELQDRPASPGELPLPFLPVVDGAFLPHQPTTALADGAAAGVTLLAGTNRDELSFFVMGDPAMADMDEHRLARWFSRAAPGVESSRVLDAYRSARTGRGESVSPRDLWVAAGSDLVFRVPTLSLAAAHQGHAPGPFVYLFTWETPAFGGSLGSCHALEIPFVFGSLRRPLVAAFAGGGPEAELLSARMQDAWLAFARSGDPSHEDIGVWPAWDHDRQATMVFGPKCGVEERPRHPELQAWGGVAGPRAEREATGAG